MSQGVHTRRRRRRRSPIFPILFIIIVVAAVVACVAALGNNETSNQILDEEQIPNEAVDSNQENTELDQNNDNDTLPETIGFQNPLTGLPVEEDISQNRPFAVMINNIRVATPQSGISNADMIYETLAEGGLTRLMAVYQDISKVPVIGSVRSARPYYLDIAQGIDAIFVHAGGSDDAYIQIRERNIDNIDGVHGSGETFFRDSWRKENMGYEHSLMLDTSLLDGYCEEHDIRTVHTNDSEIFSMDFSDTPVLPNPQKAENITVVFSGAKSTEFVYNSAENTYTVRQYGSDMTDSADSSSVEIRNLIVLEAPISQIPGDSEGRVSEDLVGTGDGYFVCDGQVTEISWSKDSYASPFKYTYGDGTPIELGRGVTYVCIIPTSGGSFEIS